MWGLTAIPVPQLRPPLSVVRLGWINAFQPIFRSWCVASRWSPPNAKSCNSTAWPCDSDCRYVLRDFHDEALQVSMETERGGLVFAGLGALGFEGIVETGLPHLRQLRPEDAVHPELVAAGTVEGSVLLIYI